MLELQVEARPVRIAVVKSILEQIEKTSSVPETVHVICDKTLEKAKLEKIEPEEARPKQFEPENVEPEKREGSSDGTVQVWAPTS